MYRNPDLFHLDLLFPIGLVEASRLGALIPLIDEASRAFGQPWVRRCLEGGRSSEWQTVSDEPEKLFLHVLQAGRGAALVERGARPLQERVRLVTSGAAFNQCVIDVHPRTGVEEQLFAKVMECLAPRFGDYLPEFSYFLWEQRLALDMALARNFGLFYLPPEDKCVTKARSIADRLPRLSLGPSQASLHRPDRIGWLNYWTPAVAEHFGFPDEEKDVSIISRCYRTPSGAWLVKLTDEPLDLEREDHVDSIVWAYWRFDKVGKRLQPADGRARPRAGKANLTPVVPARSKTFVLRERDEGGKWWEASTEPIVASSTEDALRIHFAKMVHGRSPRPKETLASLRAAYDAIAVEVGLARADDVEAVEAPGDRVAKGR